MTGDNIVALYNHVDGSFLSGYRLAQAVKLGGGLDNVSYPVSAPDTFAAQLRASYLAVGDLTPIIDHWTYWHNGTASVPRAVLTEKYGGKTIIPIPSEVWKNIQSSIRPNR